ncbi:sensor histidine kinase [Micromonospora sonneratiae]|uniref:histidine kinase n=1 Tax=Micromonospora sonneratiae TaxID=1184706 RepID=A0ABW3YK94_9ACTN
MRTRNWVVDASLALALILISVIGTGPAGANQPGTARVDGIALGLAAAVAAMLVVRRRWPVTTLAGTALVTGVYLLLNLPYGPILVSLAVAGYTVAVSVPMRRALAAGGLALPVVLLHTVTGRVELAEVLPVAAWIVVPFAVGATVRVGRETAARDREERLRQRAYDERLRIAQEVHDVVGHGLAAINMQAEIALHLLAKRPGQAEEALAAISRTSREALDELRVTLSVVRAPGTGRSTDDDRTVPGPPGQWGADPGHGPGHDPVARSSGDPVSPSDLVGSPDAVSPSDLVGSPDLVSRESRAPVPGLDQLDVLRDRLATAGLSVRVVVTGQRPDLPAAVDLAAYRIVQESLTNVVRHAGAATALVRVHRGEDEVTVEVTDTGSAVPRRQPGQQRRSGSPDPVVGHGLVGMRERAVALGGTFVVGPMAGGGFRVYATLPVWERP